MLALSALLWRRRLQEMRAFWVPGKTPEARAFLDKPEMSTLCPASGDKLKLKVGGLLGAGWPCVWPGAAA
jgi:hypothetical protein